MTLPLGAVASTAADAVVVVCARRVGRELAHATFGPSLQLRVRIAQRRFGLLHSCRELLNDAPQQLYPLHISVDDARGRLLEVRCKRLQKLVSHIHKRMIFEPSRYEICTIVG